MANPVSYRLEGFEVTGTEITFDESAGLNLTKAVVEAAGVDTDSEKVGNLKISGILTGQAIADFMSKDNSDSYSFSNGEYTIEGVVDGVTLRVIVTASAVEEDNQWKLVFKTKEVTSSDSAKIAPDDVSKPGEEFASLTLAKNFDNGMKLTQANHTAEGLQIHIEADSWDY